MPSPPRDIVNSKPQPPFAKLTKAGAIFLRRLKQMNSFAPSTEQKFSGSPHDRTAGADAGQSSDHSPRRLVRGFHRSIMAAFTIQPLVFLVSLAPLHLEGTIIVTTWVALMLTYILSTTDRMRSDLRTGERKWNELRDQANEMADAYYKLACAHERLKNKYNGLYAEHLRQRGATLLVAKKARGAAADLPSGVNGSAAVVHEFPNPKGVA